MKNFFYLLFLLFLASSLMGCQLDRVIIEQHPYSEGLAAVKNNNNQWGFVNRQGLVMVPFKYEYAMPFSEGLAAVQKNGKWGYIDWKGRVVIPFKYDHVERYDDFQFKNGWAMVDYKGNVYLIDRYGKLD